MRIIVCVHTMTVMVIGLLETIKDTKLLTMLPTVAYVSYRAGGFATATAMRQNTCKKMALVKQMS